MTRRKTPEEWIEDFKRVHGKTYGYDNVNGVFSNRNPVPITCFIHGDFLQRPEVHQGGSGCPSCALARQFGKRRKSPAEWIKDFTQVHGETYGYDKVKGQFSSKDVVTIRCFVHGDFHQSPGAHRSGQGCPSCAKARQLGRKVSRSPKAGRTPLTATIVNDRIASRGLLLIGQYSTSTTKTEFKCAKGHSWQARPNDILMGNGCPRCAGNIRLTKATINERISPRGLLLIDEYVSARQKAKFGCAKGHSWFALPSSVASNKTGCPYCSQKTQHTVESINERIAMRGLSVISSVTNIKTKAIFSCSYGHTWKTTPNHVLNGSGCPVCSNRKPLLHDEISSRLLGSGIRMIGEYINTATRTEFECEEKAHRWHTTPNSVMAGTRCPFCGNRAPLSQDVVNSRAPLGIRMVSDYKNSYTKSLFECDSGHTWSGLPRDIMRGHGCPQCAGTAKQTIEIINERIQHRGLKMIGEYISSSTPATFECSQGHRWDAVPSSVTRGSGCSACAERGFNPAKQGTLYYLRVTSSRNKVFYKIGITNLTVKARFGPEKMKMICVLREWLLGGKECQARERSICNEFKKSCILKKDAPFLDADGYREMFYWDVLGLDYHSN